jgi:hypothetical protein
MDFIIGLLKSTYRGAIYNSILVVIDRYIKMARYVPCNKIIDAKELINMIMDEIIHPYSILEGIVTNRGSVFISNY